MTNLPTSCEEMILLTQAEVDGELDTALLASVAAHRAVCARCAAAYRIVWAARRAVSAHLSYHRAPDDFRQAIEAKLREARAAASASPAGPSTTSNTASADAATGRVVPLRQRWWRPGWSRAGAAFVSGAAVAAAALLTLMPSGSNLAETVVAGHMRALQPGHLVDVTATPEGFVKPWFVGKLDYAPPMKNLAQGGFPLDGCRLDYLDGRPVAALVYQAGHHPIDLFIWPSHGGDDTAPSASVHKGYTVVHWTQAKMTVWAVSDADPGTLHSFVERWREEP